ncbi:MAG: hypothetical protein ACYCQJ_01040 [Nitrososphaerales archaeon]
MNYFENPEISNNENNWRDNRGRTFGGQPRLGTDIASSQANFICKRDPKLVINNNDNFIELANVYSNHNHDYNHKPSNFNYNLVGQYFGK